MTRTRAKKLRDKLAKEEERRAEAKKAIKVWEDALLDPIYLLGGLAAFVVVGCIVGLVLHFLN